MRLKRKNSNIVRILNKGGKAMIYGRVILCQNRIYPSKDDRLVTYCMRPAGHSGPCDIKARPEDKEPQQNAGSSDK